ncbi:MAG TPA: MMPL family transporter [Solirubrobacteraceae bacterium]|nr:MMPL family transporter [Solirubrobacteraceae bacterium]
MSSFLASLARTLTHRWKRGLIGLVAGILIVGAIIGSQSGSAPDDFSIPGTESQRAQDLLESKFPSAAGVSGQIVFTVKSGKLTDAEPRQAIESALAAVGKLPNVTSASDPLAQEGGALSEDARTGYSTVQYDLQPTDLEKEDGEKLEETAREAEKGGVQVELRGQPIDIAAEQEAPVGELVGIAIAIVLLTLLFRSLAAMAVTLFGALIGVMISQLVLAAVSKPIGIPDFATTIAVMLGLGAGIDYALLIFSRFREQLAAGDSPPEASARANATAGVSVVAAGAIVMVAIAGLLAVGIPLVGKMGVGAAIAVAFVVVSSIAVLPIFAGMMARWLHPKDPAHVARSEGFERWGRILVKRPVVPVVVGGLLLLLLSVPTLDLRLGQPDDGNQPEDKTQRVAYDQLSEGFGPGFNGPFLLAVGSKTDGKLDQAQLTKLEDALRKTPGLAFVAPPQPNEAGDAAIIQAIPTTSPQDARTSELVGTLRDDVIPASTQGSDLNVYVGGQTAGFEDFSDKIAARLPIFIAIVIGLSILLLIAVFRSVWVPLVSAVFNLLSIGAAYGVVVAVFQWGWGASVLGVGDDVPIISFVPLMMFAILFGLSMDYNVFLLSRIREAYFEGDSPKDSVVHGLSRIAKVVLVAGLIMASVFLAFMSGSDVTIKMFGLGLGAAILIDVLIVRMIVSPALMAILGDKAWWMPKWLDKIIPNVSLEGGHDDREARATERERVAA